MDCKFISHAPRPPRSPTREHQKGVAFQLTGVKRYTEIYSHKQNAYTIDPLSRRLLGIRKIDDKKVNGNMVGIREDTKENEEKAKVIPRAWRDKAD